MQVKVYVPKIIEIPSEYLPALAGIAGLATDTATNSAVRRVSWLLRIAGRTPRTWSSLSIWARSETMLGMPMFRPAGRKVAGVCVIGSAAPIELSEATTRQGNKLPGAVAKSTDCAVCWGIRFERMDWNSPHVVSRPSLRRFRSSLYIRPGAFVLQRFEQFGEA